MPKKSMFPEEFWRTETYPSRCARNVMASMFCRAVFACASALPRAASCIAMAASLGRLPIREVMFELRQMIARTHRGPACSARAVNVRQQRILAHVEFGQLAYRFWL